MTTPLPTLCARCAVDSPLAAECACDVCADAELPERLLCDLNRRAHGASELRCFAYRPPRLRVFCGGRARARQGGSSTAQEPGAPCRALKSDRFKYQAALTQQLVSRDPGSAAVVLKSHLVWTCAARFAAFAKLPGSLDRIQAAFLQEAESLRCTAALLEVAPDHLHVYAESDGSRSIEAVVARLKAAAAAALCGHPQWPAVQPALPGDLWDLAYYAGSLE